MHEESEPIEESISPAFPSDTDEIDLDSSSESSE